MATAKKLMRAVQYNSYKGGAAALKHVEIPIPKPSKGHLLVKLEATSLNPLDWKIQNGAMRPIIPRKFPYIPATDVAGEVMEIGSDVKDFKAGDKVVAHLGFTGGGLAEYAIVNENLTVLRPPQVSAAGGASLSIAGLTAHQALVEKAGLKIDGDSVNGGSTINILVTAASGGVGHFAVQLAKLGNTHVTATCSARNIDLVKSLGADEVLDYKTEEGVKLKSPSGKKYDIVIHCTNGISWSTFEPNLSVKGMVIHLSPGPSDFCILALQKLTLSKKQLVPLFAVVKKVNLDYLVKLVAEKKVNVIIDSQYPLSKAEDAWAKSLEGHVTGKIIVEP